MLPEKLKWYLKHKSRVLTTLVISTRQSQQTEFVCKKVVSGGQFLSFQKTSVQMQGEKPQQSKPSAVRCVINTLLLHCNGTRALARLWNDLTSCQPLSYSPWMSIQDTAVTPRQHSVNTEVIIREKPGTNSSTSHEEAGSLGQNQKDWGILLSHNTTVQQHHTALKNLFHGTSAPALPWAFSLCLPSQKRGLMAQKKQVSFQGIYSCSGNSEMLAEAGWQGSESSWAAGRGSQHTQKTKNFI